MGFEILIGIIVIAFLGVFVSKFTNHAVGFTKYFAWRTARGVTSFIRYLIIGGIVALVLFLAYSMS